MSLKKVCPQCGKALPLMDFNKNTARADGLQSWCRRCYKVKAEVVKKRHQEKWSRVNPYTGLPYTEDDGK